MRFGSIKSDSTHIATLIPAVSMRGDGLVQTPVILALGPLKILAWRVSAVATQQVIWSVEKPPGWAGEDLSLSLDWALVNNQTNGDEISVTTNYLAYTAFDPAQGIDKARTQLTTVRAVTTAEGLESGDVYRTQLTIAADDASNPLADCHGLCFEVELTNFVGVTAADLLHASLTIVEAP